MLSQLDARDNSFDTIRLFAAYAVIFSHAFPLNDQPEPLIALTGQMGIGTLAVCIFFLISGYLIPASLERSTLSQYAIKRARRILPALIAAVLICAFVLGPIATSLPLTAYLTDLGTWRFLGNIGFLPVGYSLPGVFAGNPLEAVNGSLWSLKFEVACYFFVPIAMAVLPLRKTVVIVTVIASFVLARVIDPEWANGAYYVQKLAFLFQFYGMGMLFFLFAGRIPVSTPFAWASLAIATASAFTPLFVEAMAIFGSYAVMVFAYRSPAAFKHLTRRGDISYGVYVYAFPIQQLLVPITMGYTFAGMQSGWLVNTVLTLPLVSIAGILSWILIEKPALLYRRKPRAEASFS